MKIITAAQDLKARSAVKFDEKSLEDAKSKSKLKMKKLAEAEHEIITNKKYNTTVSRGKPSFGHFQVFLQQDF